MSARVGNLFRHTASAIYTQRFLGICLRFFGCLGLFPRLSRRDRWPVELAVTGALVLACVSLAAVIQAEAATSGTVSINNGAAYTNSKTVQLSLYATDDVAVSSYYISTKNTAPGTKTKWIPVVSPAAILNTPVNFTLAGTAGVNWVYVWYKGSSQSTVATDSIIYDKSLPKDGALVATPGDGLVQLSWGGFSDPGSGIAGYMVAYAAGQAAPKNCASAQVYTSGTLYTHSPLANNTQYSYRVCAVDEAGNISKGVSKSVTPAAGIKGGISGRISAGPVSDGVVIVNSINSNGSVGPLLAMGFTNSSGYYSFPPVTLAGGNVLVTVGDGSYTDEATGDHVVPAPRMRAALTGIAGKSVRVAVTPMTELAVEIANSCGAGLLTKSCVTNSNITVSGLVGFDIVGTLPTDVKNPAEVQSQLGGPYNYGLMLAAVSAFTAEGDPLATVGLMANDISANHMFADTGAGLSDALYAFIDDGAHNTGGVIPSDADYLVNLLTTEPPLTITTTTGDLNKAKLMVSDLRDTALYYYDYNLDKPGRGTSTALTNITNDMENNIIPELTDAADTITSIVDGMSYIYPGMVDYTYLDNGQVLIVDSSSDTNEAFAVIDPLSCDYGADPLYCMDSHHAAVYDSGSYTLNNASAPTAGIMDATLTTGYGPGAAHVAYTGTTSGGKLASMAFTGYFELPGVTFDFSQAGRKLMLTKISTNPDGSIVPQSIAFSGEFASASTTADVTLSATRVYNNLGHTWLPSQAAFNGKLTEFETDTVFSGALSANWTNASTYNTNVKASATNWPKWSGTFNGAISAPSMPALSSILATSQTGWNIFSFSGTVYELINADDSVASFINVNGTFDDSADKGILNLGIHQPGRHQDRHTHE